MEVTKTMEVVFSDHYYYGRIKKHSMMCSALALVTYNKIITMSTMRQFGTSQVPWLSVQLDPKSNLKKY